jgi:hypothetical protein
MVEGVKHFSTKLEMQILQDLEVPHKPKVKVVHSGPNELIATPATQSFAG